MSTPRTSPEAGGDATHGSNPTAQSQYGSDPSRDHMRTREPGTSQAFSGPPADPSTRTAAAPDRAVMAARQKERFGGVKLGCAFFGWLTATGMAVILIALLAAAGVAFGVATDTTADEATQQAESGTGTAQTVGLIGAITLLVIIFVAYYCGGYVAGRMARFNGLRQGLAVWVWGLLMVLVTAAIAAIAGSQYDIFASLNLPRLPVNEGDVTAVGAIAIGAALLAALVAAMLGGLAGMHFHRKVDKSGLGPVRSEIDDR